MPSWFARPPPPTRSEAADAETVSIAPPPQPANLVPVYPRAAGYDRVPAPASTSAPTPPSQRPPSTAVPLAKPRRSEPTIHTPSCNIPSHASRRLKTEAGDLMEVDVRQLRDNYYHPYESTPNPHARAQSREKDFREELALSRREREIWRTGFNNQDTGTFGTFFRSLDDPVSRETWRKTPREI